MLFQDNNEQHFVPSAHMWQTDLVTCSNVLLIAVDMNALSDVRRLLLQGHKHITGLIVEACA